MKTQQTPDKRPAKTISFSMPANLHDRMRNRLEELGESVRSDSHYLQSLIARDVRDFTGGFGPSAERLFVQLSRAHTILSHMDHPDLGLSPKAAELVTQAEECIELVRQSLYEFAHPVPEKPPSSTAPPATPADAAARDGATRLVAGLSPSPATADTKLQTSAPIAGGQKKKGDQR